MVTTGSTDVAGYVQATLANGLDAYQDNPAFENETTGQITLAVNYTNANDDDIQAFTVTEDLAPYYDPVLQQQTVKDGSGSVLASASLVVNVEPQYTGSWPRTPRTTRWASARPMAPAILNAGSISMACRAAVSTSRTEP